MDKLDTLREAALRLDQAHEALFQLTKRISKAKADLAQAETNYAKALDALHSASLDTECSR